MSQKTSRFIALLDFCLAFLPFLVGLLFQNEQYIYSGFLLNPTDGYSYLAKMQIGMRGEWVFNLPYTAQQGQGAYLFLFYILLGHLARILNLQPIIVFHLARLVSMAVFIYGLEAFLRSIQVKWLKTTNTYLLAVILFGSGLGWLAGLLGVFTMDFWVAEAYPFLSLIANPHFPLGIGLILVFFSRFQQKDERVHWYDPVFGAVLGITLPFGVVVGVVVSAIYNLLLLIQRQTIQWKLPLFYFFPAGIILIYQYAAILFDPLLAEWNFQNQTPTPSLPIVLVSFTPLILLAVIGVIYWVFKERDPNLNLTVAWFISGISLAYFPFSLQRRFLLGWLIPVGVLALMGLGRLVNFQVPRFRRWFWFIFPAGVLTNLFLLLGAYQVFTQHQFPLYITQADYAGLKWMQQEICNERPVILAPEDLGLSIPAQTNCRVIYGHPFETINAQETLEWLGRFYSGRIEDDYLNQLIELYQVDYIIWKRTPTTPPAGWSKNLPLVYENEQILIYRAK
jgi:uncharacterized membrane protein